MFNIENLMSVKSMSFTLIKYFLNLELKRHIFSKNSYTFYIYALVEANSDNKTELKIYQQYFKNVKQNRFTHPIWNKIQIWQKKAHQYAQKTQIEIVDY